MKNSLIFDVLAKTARTTQKDVFGIMSKLPHQVGLVNVDIAALDELGEGLYTHWVPSCCHHVNSLLY